MPGYGLLRCVTSIRPKIEQSRPKTRQSFPRLDKISFDKLALTSYYPRQDFKLALAAKIAPSPLPGTCASTHPLENRSSLLRNLRGTCPPRHRRNLLLLFGRWAAAMLTKPFQLCARPGRRRTHCSVRYRPGLPMSAVSRWTEVSKHTQ